MQSKIQEYIDKINKQYKTGISTEHSYRADLQNLLGVLCPDVLVTNEPSRIACGAPDYILTKKNIPIGYIEAKDIGEPLDGKKKHKEQFDRYKGSLSNLIFTDYLDFWLYRDGQFITSIRIAEIVNGKINAFPEKYIEFENLIKEFAIYVGQTIRSAEKLSKMMAGKARLMKDIFNNALEEDEKKYLTPTTELQNQFNAFKDILIHDIKLREFADIYAQTIAYGMFAARLHDPTLEDFSRTEAAELIPKTNPFLRKLFIYIAGADLDDRVKWIVDSLADIFRATDVSALLKNFGKSTQQHDPIIHFYETFLAEYDPKLRKSRGVWYTPEPVVKFIVRAVDDILKTEFGLKDGLADTSKTKIKLNTQTIDNRSSTGYKQIEQDVHKVQILDPAAGTGTFLAEVVKHIYKKFDGQQGIWNTYVENHLLPRLNGFEILMASYAMAHLKLDLLLQETGFKSKKDQRYRIYLTNSLEEHHPDTGTLFAGWLSSEANEANHIKRDTPVMVVLGNPPYSGESANKGEWIMKLMEDYKKEPGGKVKLKEKNPKWINDDYVKFLRYGQYFVEKNGEGVLAFINPHGYLDNPTFRGMRWHLLQTYDKIYTINLHGNSKKKETAPDGSIDQNVFDIMQGVSINILLKTGNKKSNKLGKVYYYDLFGKREDKYQYLRENSIKNIPFSLLHNKAPMYFMVHKDFKVEEEYSKGFLISDLFKIFSAGIVTARDSFTIRDSENAVKDTITQFLSLENAEARMKFNLGKDVRDWTINFAKKDLNISGPDYSKIVKISYRLFDVRFTYYTGNSRGFHCMPRGDVMKHYLQGKNLGLALCKQFKSGKKYVHCFLSDRIIESSYVSNRTSEITSTFPLFLYLETNDQQTIGENEKRTSNLNQEIVRQIAQKIGLTFTIENEDTEDTFASIDILDYIYAVLHSPTYREKYKEFLKIDFPRVPYPKDKQIFWQLVKLGGELRQIHLLESPTIENFITKYPIDGDNVVNKPSYQDGKVYINETQYFDKVPVIAWEFYIGGYQPAQKWLKDRKGRTLTYEDIRHYQKIIVALFETDKIMKEIDKIKFM
jgi:predicted helicase